MGRPAGGPTQDGSILLVGAVDGQLGRGALFWQVCLFEGVLVVWQCIFWGLACEALFLGSGTDEAGW